MRKILILMTAFYPLLAGAQTNTFTVKGQIGTLGTPAKVYLIYKQGANKVLDSAYVNNGSFAITGNISSPVSASLLLDHNGGGFTPRADNKYDVLEMYLDKGIITITGTDSVKTAQITGSGINFDNKKLLGQLASINTRAQKIIAEAKAATIEQQHLASFQNSIQDKLRPLQAEQENILKGFVKNNPNSYISLLALSSLGGPDADPAAIEPLYAGLSADIRETDSGKSLGMSINKLKVTAIGAMAPDFTQPDASGIPITLSSFKGRYVLVDFWASWCGPCRQENPNVVRAFNKYKTKKFAILGVSLDGPDGKANWLGAVRDDGLTWTQVSDLKQWNNAAAATYFVTSIPQNYLLDPTGRIIAKNLRGDDLEKKLAEIFGR